MVVRGSHLEAYQGVLIVFSVVSFTEKVALLYNGVSKGVQELSCAADYQLQTC